MTRSNRPPPGAAVVASAVSVSTSRPAAASRSRAKAARSGSISVETTRPGPARQAASAAFQPCPPPMSHTRCPDSSCSESSLSTTTPWADRLEDGSPPETWVTAAASWLAYSSAAQPSGSACRSTAA